MEGVPAGPPSPERVAEIESQITTLYEKFCPDKVPKIGYFMNKYKGKEESLLAQVRAKYILIPKKQAAAKRKAEAEAAPPAIAVPVSVDWRKYLTDFYHRFQPAKIQKIDDLMRKYEGKEIVMIVKLHVSYEIPIPNGFPADIDKQLRAGYAIAMKAKKGKQRPPSPNKRRSIGEMALAPITAVFRKEAMAELHFDAHDSDDDDDEGVPPPSELDSSPVGGEKALPTMTKKRRGEGRNRISRKT